MVSQKEGDLRQDIKYFTFFFNRRSIISMMKENLGKIINNRDWSSIALLNTLSFVLNNFQNYELLTSCIQINIQRY